MIDRTFQLMSGMGPWREKDLWARGIQSWDAFDRASENGVIVAKKLDAELRTRIAEGREAVARKDLSALSKLIPAR